MLRQGRLRRVAVERAQRARDGGLLQDVGRVHDLVDGADERQRPEPIVPYVAQARLHEPVRAQHPKRPAVEERR